MKKLLFIILMHLLFAWTALITGCNRTDEHHFRYKFAIIPRRLGSDFHHRLVQGAVTESEKRNLSLTVLAPISDDDYLFQQKQLEKLVANKNIDGVLITPNHSEALRSTITRLNQASIPFIIVDTPIDFSDEHGFKSYCGFVGTDNQFGGRLASEFIAKELPKGDVLLIRGIKEQQTSKDREKGFLEGLKKYPDISVLKTIEGRWKPDIVKKRLEQMPASERSKIDAIFALNDPMALSAVEYFKNFDHRPLIVGYDGLIEAQKAILNGLMDATIAQAPDLMGKIAVGKLVDCLESETFTGENLLTYVTLLKATKVLTSISDYE